jgi:uncharacterized PurR-regulated membrane protein YhhQ (DUF165 family)
MRRWWIALMLGWLFGSAFETLHFWAVATLTIEVTEMQEHINIPLVTLKMAF